MPSKAGHPLGKVSSMHLRNNGEDPRTLNAFARTDLELPLTRHNFCVDTRHLNAGEQTGLVMSLDKISGIYLAGSHTAIVWSLRTWETSLGPTIRPSVKTKKSVFLL